MINIGKVLLIAASVGLSSALIGNGAVAVEIATGMEQPVNETVKHLEAALAATAANDLETVQEHLKAARQSAKKIIGGTLEGRAQRGSDAIVNARLQAKEGNTEAVAVSLKQALDIFKSMFRSSNTASQGGLK